MKAFWIIIISNVLLVSAFVAAVMKAAVPLYPWAAIFWIVLLLINFQFFRSRHAVARSAPKPKSFFARYWFVILWALFSFVFAVYSGVRGLLSGGGLGEIWEAIGALLWSLFLTIVLWQLRRKYPNCSM